MNQNNTKAIVAHKVTKSVSLPSAQKNKSEKQLTILSDIELTIHDGESIAIVGASGSGKSTLLGLLAGLDLPTSGEVHFYGKAIHTLDEEQRAQIRRSDVGFIFQQFLLVPSLTALENVMLPAELSDDKSLRDKAKSLATEWLEKVGLGHRLDHFPNQLSGGEQQRVAIARAFITQPKLLFADEPSANLDTENGKLVEDLLFELNQRSNITLVLVTHAPELAARCQRVVTIHGGHLTEEAKSTQDTSEGEVDNLDLAVSEAISNAFYS
ncbi:MAG: ATP-binding cassette domain-containing protein [Gammaproteobacteria bacterium]|nr:ATP-binding cassette domain-containing protein [Gammaproteobacteria bacterium]